LHASYWYVAAVILATGLTMALTYRRPSDAELAASR
jgi:hypothetical protein